MFKGFPSPKSKMSQGGEEEEGEGNEVHLGLPCGRQKVKPYCTKLPIAEKSQIEGSSSESFIWHTGEFALKFCRKALIFDETIEQWIRSGSRTVLLERALALALETYPCCMSVFGLLQGLLDRSSFGGKFPFPNSR